MELALLVLLGVGLSAASGFRIFVPPLVLSVVARVTGFDLPGSLEWLASPVAILLLGAATVVEVLAYYIPWLDNLLDTIATPAAVIAGTLMTGAFGAELDPVLRWSLALVAGGGTAGGINALTVVTRLASTATTGGLGNPVIATVENAAATALSVLAIFLPVAAFVLVVVLVGVAFRQIRRLRRKRVA